MKKAPTISGKGFGLLLEGVSTFLHWYPANFIVVDVAPFNPLKIASTLRVINLDLLREFKIDTITMDAEHFGTLSCRDVRTTVVSSKVSQIHVGVAPSLTNKNLLTFFPSLRFILPRSQFRDTFSCAPFTLQQTVSGLNHVDDSSELFFGIVTNDINDVVVRISNDQSLCCCSHSIIPNSEVSGLSKLLKSKCVEAFVYIHIITSHLYQGLTTVSEAVSARRLNEYLGICAFAQHSAIRINDL